MHPDLDSRLRHLRLGGMAQTLPVRNQEAITNHLAYVDFLDLLVEDELNRRRDRLLARRIAQAGLPQLKTLDDFNWSFNPGLPKALILDLATVRFVAEHAGLLLIGPPGVGKSHICLSLALAAIHAGYTVLYRSAFDLAEDLSEAAALEARKELVQKLTRVDLLVIEDLGMRRLPPTAAEDLLEVFTRRYEVGATLLYVIWNLAAALSWEEGARGRNPSLWTLWAMGTTSTVHHGVPARTGGRSSRGIPRRVPGCASSPIWACRREPSRRTPAPSPTT